MKIGPLDNKATGPTATERKTSGSSPSKAPEASATVALSSTAAALDVAAADTAFDTRKVDRIATAIRDGQYTVDAEAIADKLIENARELLQGRPN